MSIPRAGGRRPERFGRGREQTPDTDAASTSPSSPSPLPFKPRMKSNRLSEEEQARREALLQRIDPKGYGLFDPKSFEGDDLYILLAPHERGNTEIVSVRVPSEMKQAAEYLLATRTTPFSNIGELMKSGLMMVLRACADVGRGDTSWRTSVRTLNLRVAKLRMERRQRDIGTYLAEGEQTIHEMVAGGQHQEAVELFGQLKGEVQGFDDSSWKKQGLEWVGRMAPLFEGIAAHAKGKKTGIKIGGKK